MITKKDLLNNVCVACEGGVEPFTLEKAKEYLSLVPEWKLSDNAKIISHEFKFKDFIGAINFVEKVAELAEMEGHHPDIHIHFNKVLLELSTHAIRGLSENDFIVAAKVDAMQ